MSVEEIMETPLSIYVSDNKRELMREFIGDNRDLFEEFNNQFGEDTHGNIEVGFCEYHYQLWDRFCREKFADID